MKKVLFIMLALCASGVMMAQVETTTVPELAYDSNKQLDINYGKMAAYHAIINVGIGCYYKDNENSNIKGPDAVDGIYSITVINGAQLGPRVYIGLGIGFESLMTARGWDERNNPTIDYQPGKNIYYGFPVFVEGRWYLNKMKTVSPYLLVDVGYEAWRNDKYGKYKDIPEKLWQSCFYFNGGFGIRFGRYLDCYCTAGLRDVQIRLGVEL